MSQVAQSGRELARRLREIRVGLFGPSSEGGDAMARRLELPPRTWRNYESGVTIPGLQLLRFIARTGVHPSWLLDGEGDRYLPHSVERLDIPSGMPQADGPFAFSPRTSHPPTAHPDNHTP